MLRVQVVHMTVELCWSVHLKAFKICKQQLYLSLQWIPEVLHLVISHFLIMQAEVKRIHDAKPVGEGLTYGEYKSMTYIHKVIDETLRLVNIAPMVFREVKSDIQVAGNLGIWLRTPLSLIS